jgi:hypothetical protein
MTPMIDSMRQQYLEIKRQYPGAIVFAWAILRNV